MVTISDISFDGGGQHTPPYVVDAELPSLEDRKSHINLHSFLYFALIALFLILPFIDFAPPLCRFQLQCRHQMDFISDQA